MNKEQGTTSEMLVNSIISLANEQNRTLADLSMDDIAEALGMSRMTLYRKIGSKQSLHNAARRLGYDPGEEPDARERAIDAAADLIRQDGIAALTLESVSLRAGCALPTIYAQFGNRNGLLIAVFDRYVPIFAVKDVLVDVGDFAGFQRVVARGYRVIFDAIERDRQLFRALLAEALRDPKGDVDAFLIQRYVPAVAAHIVPWLQRHMDAGVIAELPVVLLLHQFIAPVLLHAATRPVLESADVFDVPSPEDTCDELARLFAQSVFRTL